MNLTAEELRNKIDNKESFVVDIYADWCGPCKMMSPVIDKIVSNTLSEGRENKLFKFNVDNDKTLSTELGVRSIPNFKVFKDGEIIAQKIGMLSEIQINELIEMI
jgi:thioredoxin 1